MELRIFCPMSLTRLDVNAIEKVNGPAWTLLRQQFLDISKILLGVSSCVCGQLTTVYVKYEFQRSNEWAVFAVIWLKKSSELVVGLALPKDYNSRELHSAPPGMRYAGLTKYFTVQRGKQPTEELTSWAKHAFDFAVEQYTQT